MSEIFHVYASQGPNKYVEMDLPASDYEMLDLMERLRLEPGQPPYVEILKFRDGYDYLEKCIPELPDIYQLNALAKKLAEFTSVSELITQLLQEGRLIATDTSHGQGIRTATTKEMKVYRQAAEPINGQITMTL